ncbi:hypothetical protein KQX54_002453 [Cotesia glomerata]|uniref:Uncharacterized protein n=1 Tax=Cotesia glomerata TaxID=32391 RepID=A0AAV7I6C3_COTGL|nr:hypothetical protein KQX54_002453 [Cotesia glomerata]
MGYPRELGAQCMNVCIGTIRQQQHQHIHTAIPPLYVFYSTLSCIGPRPRAPQNYPYYVRPTPRQAAFLQQHILCRGSGTLQA